MRRVVQHVHGVLAAVICGALSMAAPAAAQTVYSVTDVGLLPGCTYATASGLNAYGDVAGFCLANVNTGLARAFAWKGGTLTDLGRLPGGTFNLATAINASGTIVGQGDASSAAQIGWVTRSGSLSNFFSNNGGLTRTIFISDAGAIGGVYTTSKSGWLKSVKGAVWTIDPKDPRRYRKADLPVLPGGIDPKSSWARPAGFNQAMQMAGYAQTDQVGTRAVFWNNDVAHTIVDLGTLPDDWFSEAKGLNDLEQIVGVSYGAIVRPVLWGRDAARTAEALPLLPGDNIGWAVALNNAGVIVGDSHAEDLQPGMSGLIATRAVVWRNGAVSALDSLLEPVTGAGWTIVEVTGINDQGQISATGVRNGQTRALLLTPAQP